MFSLKPGCNNVCILNHYILFFYPGALVDKVGAYSSSFYLGGSCLLLASFILIIPCRDIEKKESKNKLIIHDVTIVPELVQEVNCNGSGKPYTDNISAITPLNT